MYKIYYFQCFKLMIQLAIRIIEKYIYMYVCRYRPRYCLLSITIYIFYSIFVDLKFSNKKKGNVSMTA